MKKTKKKAKKKVVKRFNPLALLRGKLPTKTEPSTKRPSAQSAAAVVGRLAEKDLAGWCRHHFPTLSQHGKDTPAGESSCRVRTPEGVRNRIWDYRVGLIWIEMKHVAARKDSVLGKIMGDVYALLFEAHGLPIPPPSLYLRDRLSKPLCTCAVATPMPDYMHIAQVCRECERLCTARDREKVRSRLTPPPIVYVVRGAGAEDPAFLERLENMLVVARERGGQSRDIANRVHLWTWTEMQQQGFLTEARRRMITG